MPGVAGRKAILKVPGAGVVFTTDPMTNSGDNLTYQITNVVKRVWDPTAAITVFSNAVLQAATTYKLNRLTGRVTFNASQGANPVTVTGTYRPMAAAVTGRKYSASLEAQIVSDDDWDNIVTSSGFSNKMHTVMDASGSFTAKFGPDVFLRDALLNATMVVLEFFPDRAGAHDFLIWCNIDKVDLQAALETVQERTVQFHGDADIDGNVAGI